jgi:hypothetical protein
MPAPERGEEYLLPGAYWVERRGPMIFVFPLPAERGETSAWFPLNPADDAWYLGDGLYSLNPDQFWTLQLSSTESSFDDFMLHYDPAPAAPASDADDQ